MDPADKIEIVEADIGYCQHCGFIIQDDGDVQCSDIDKMAQCCLAPDYIPLEGAVLKPDWNYNEFFKLINYKIEQW